MAVTVLKKKQRRDSTSPHNIPRTRLDQLPDTNECEGAGGVAEPACSLENPWADKREFAPGFRNGTNCPSQVSRLPRRLEAEQEVSP